MFGRTRRSTMSTPMTANEMREILADAVEGAVVPRRGC
jgi:hypothetical protein